MSDGKSGISRREFVKAGSAAAALAPALSLAGKAFGSQVTNEIRCAVIGTGGRGRDAHIRSILKVPGARVVAVCDPSRQALEQALAIVPGEKPATYTHHRELLDRESLDAVFIASPPAPHREQIVETLRKNLHCYAEKPVVLTVSDVEEVEREAGKSKGLLQVGQQLRYSTASRTIARMVHEGEIGRIGFVRAQRMSSWYGPGSEEPSMRWLWSVEESGDQLVEQSIHNIDQINWVLDAHPVKCTGLGGQNMVYEPTGRDTSDHFTVVYEYPGRRIVTFTMIKYATAELGGSFTHFYGEKGACDLQGHRFIGRERDAKPRVVEVPEDEDATQLAIDDFFRCIREGRQPRCGIQTAKTALLTTLLGRKAFFEERVVTWEDLLREDAPVRRVSDRATA
ncbi:MAG TPA: Gfo/Idh/MocA family oxidoreductase [Vicinamibacteria bacterium]